MVRAALLVTIAALVAAAAAPAAGQALSVKIVGVGTQAISGGTAVCLKIRSSTYPGMPGSKAVPKIKIKVVVAIAPTIGPKSVSAITNTRGLVTVVVRIRSAKHVQIGVGSVGPEATGHIATYRLPGFSPLDSGSPKLGTATCPAGTH